MVKKILIVFFAFILILGGAAQVYACTSTCSYKILRGKVTLLNTDSGTFDVKADLDGQMEHFIADATKLNVLQVGDLVRVSFSPGLNKVISIKKMDPAGPKKNFGP